MAIFSTLVFSKPSLSLKVPTFIRNLLKTTRFWQENRLILRELRHFRRQMVLSILFALTSTVTAAVSIGLIGALLQGLTNPQAPPIQTHITWIDVSLLATRASPSERIFRLAGLALVVNWLQAAATYRGQLLARSTAIGLVNRLRKRLFEQLQSLHLSYFLTAKTGALVNTLTSEVNQLQQALITSSSLATQIFMILGYSLSMVMLSWQLTLVTVFIFGLLSVGLSAIRAKVRESSFAVPQANKQFTAVTLELINGIRTVHASGTQDFERQRYYRAADQVRDAANDMAKHMVSVQPLTQSIAGTFLIMLIIISYTTLVDSGQMEASSLLALLFAMSRTLPLVAQLSNARVNISSLQGTLHNVSELLKRPYKPYLNDGKVPYVGLKESIEFIGVDFGYSPVQPVLEGITLSIPQGQTTALVGASGAGKSTLADLIPRFFDPTAGQVLIDGVDLRDLQINTLRTRMAIVSQDTFIFNASVRDNIAYGLEQVTDAELRLAAAQANALDFILQMPEGFETELGDRGIRLSGGQRQRIAIARAILRDPEILILDEATSALDSVTERLIQEALNTLSSGRTVISIAHRLSTIANADQVVVLEQGQIVEQGCYSELINRHGYLWKYHQMQYEQTSAG